MAGCRPVLPDGKSGCGRIATAPRGGTLCTAFSAAPASAALAAGVDYFGGVELLGGGVGLLGAGAGLVPAGAGLLVAGVELLVGGLFPCLVSRFS